MMFRYSQAAVETERKKQQLDDSSLDQSGLCAEIFWSRKHIGRSFYLSSPKTEQVWESVRQYLIAPQFKNTKKEI